jgi:three-Cys-motif partner protein
MPANWRISSTWMSGQHWGSVGGRKVGTCCGVGPARMRAIPAWREYPVLGSERRVSSRIMSDLLHYRASQTKVKHQILEAYLTVWGGIITSGMWSAMKHRLERGRPATLPFVYVDAFAFTGQYLGDIEDEVEGRVSRVFGSPVIGVRALDGFKTAAEGGRLPSGSSAETRVILFENKPEAYDLLLQTLRLQGWGDRITTSADFAAYTDGQIGVVYGDFADYHESVLEYTSSYCFSFYNLDPYGPQSIPMSIVRPIIAQQGTDAMVNYITERAIRVAGFLADPTQTGARRTLLNYAFLAVEDPGEAGALVEEWCRRYHEEFDQNATRSVDWILGRTGDAYESVHQDLFVKKIPLQFQHMDREMMTLFITTKDPTGAVSINRTLFYASELEKELRYEYRLRTAMKEKETHGQYAMFEAKEFLAMRDAVSKPKVAIETLAEYISAQLTGQTVSFRQVLRVVGGTEAHPDHPPKAVRWLRKHERCSWETGKIRNSTAITFV